MHDKFLFPYDEIRPEQNQLMEDIHTCITNKTHLIAHAPTGLGKTISALAPILKYAKDNKKKIFFLTSRHTQHIIAIDTLKQIKNKFNIEIKTIDLIGKKWMCPVAGTDDLYTSEFREYCKAVREEHTCAFYNNTRKNKETLTTKAQAEISELNKLFPLHVQETIDFCKDKKLCPYEISTAINADVVIADYFYIFNPKVRMSFFNRTGIALEDCIIIVDEAHNLPQRCRDLLTDTLSNLTIRYAIKEAKKFNHKEELLFLVQLNDLLTNVAKYLNDGDERKVKKEEFTKKINNYDDWVKKLTKTGETILKEKKRSFIHIIASFLKNWKGPDFEYSRSINMKPSRLGPIITLNYKCLDPAILSRETIENSHSTILMSGTLTPTKMYKDILGFPESTMLKEYKSPFPKENKLNLIIPKTTTKFTARSAHMFQNIAEITSNITNQIPGNSAIFFPSYYLRDQVYQHFMTLSKKTNISEQPGLTKNQKEELLVKFKSYSNTGAVLLGVSSGSFGEGIDFPGDLLKGVIVVGLPLARPDIETKDLIDYYEQKFGKGWDYGYTIPAMNSCFQSAGRCIRSETDRGVIIFLDQRFAWNNYLRLFPKDWDIKIDPNPKYHIIDFFMKK